MSEITKRQRDRLARTVCVAVEHWAAIEFDEEHEVSVQIYVGHKSARVSVVATPADPRDDALEATVGIR